MRQRSILVTTFCVLAVFSHDALAQSGSPALAKSQLSRSPAGARNAKDDVAQDASRKDTAEAPAGDADALIQRGVELRRRGDDLGALSLFEQAHAEDPTPRAKAQIALAEQALGRWVQAEEHLLAALAAKDDAWIAGNEATLTSALSTIQQRLSSLTIYGGVEGAEVRVNGQPAGLLPLAEPLRVPSGGVIIEVAHEGYYTVQRQLTLAGGGRFVESITMTPRPADASPAAAPAPGSERQPVGAEPPAATSVGDGLSPALFWIGASVTAVLGGVTVWSALDTKSKNDEYESYSTGSGAEADQSRTFYDRAKSRQDRTNVFLAVTAAAGAGTAIIAAFTDWGGSESARGRTPRAVARTGADLWLLPDGARVSCHGSF